MVQGLSFRAAGARVGCSHVAISAAVKNGRIPLLPDGTVSPEAVDYWHAHRRAKRGGNHRDKGRAKLPVAATLPNAAPSDPHADVPFAVGVVAEAIVMGAYDLARILASRGMPADDVVEIVYRWIAWQRFGWVGHAQVPDAIVVIEAWPAPATGGQWHDHALFQGDPLSDDDWHTIDALHAAAIAAQHGAPAP